MGEEVLPAVLHQCTKGKTVFSINVVNQQRWLLWDVVDGAAHLRYHHYPGDTIARLPKFGYIVHHSEANSTTRPSAGVATLSEQGCTPGMLLRAKRRRVSSHQYAKQHTNANIKHTSRKSHAKGIGASHGELAFRSRMYVYCKPVLCSPIPSLNGEKLQWYASVVQGSLVKWVVASKCLLKPARVMLALTVFSPQPRIRYFPP